MNDQSAEFPSKWITEREQTSPVIVTPRRFRVVTKELRLPEDAFNPNMRVLSVGEGLSNFVRMLNKKGVKAIGVDPIYCLGGKILKTSPQKVSKALLETYGDKAKFVNFKDMEMFTDPEKKIIPPKKGQIVAGSALELPFPDETFDLVVAHQLVEHIDLEKALPELVRTLKPAGEIRLSGLKLHAFPDQGYLRSGIYEAISSAEGFWKKHPGLGNSLEWLKQQKNIYSYAIITARPGAKEGRHYPDLRICGVLIIRKDQKSPHISGADNESARNRSIMELFRGPSPEDISYPYQTNYPICYLDKKVEKG